MVSGELGGRDDGGNEGSDVHGVRRSRAGVQGARASDDGAEEPWVLDVDDEARDHRDGHADRRYKLILEASEERDG